MTENKAPLGEYDWCDEGNDTEEDVAALERHFRLRQNELERNDDSTEDSAVSGTDVKPELLISSSDSEQNVCRVCQLPETDTGEKLRSTHCNCRGSIGLAHRSCLREWIKHSRSNICELCNSRFRHTKILVLDPGLLDEDFQAMPPCSDTRRRYFIFIFFGLLLTTAAAAALTFVTMDDYEKAWKDNYKNRNASAPREMSMSELDTYRLYYGLALSVLIFCACFTFAVLFIWALLEIHCPIEYPPVMQDVPYEHLRVVFDDEELSDSEDYFNLDDVVT